VTWKLAQPAGKHWTHLEGQNQLPKIIRGVSFAGGIKVAKEEAQTAI
jgi:hypothetical protein